MKIVNKLSVLLEKLNKNWVEQIDISSLSITDMDDNTVLIKKQVFDDKVKRKDYEKSKKGDRAYITIDGLLAKGKGDSVFNSGLLTLVNDKNGISGIFQFDEVEELDLNF